MTSMARVETDLEGQMQALGKAARDAAATPLPSIFRKSAS